MGRKIRIGIIGDFDPNKISHPATVDAIRHAAGRLSIETQIAWLPTPSMLTGEGQEHIKEFDCIWASSGGPYESMDGMIRGIQIARELGKPFIGT